MRRYLLAGVSVLVVSNSLAAQESLWSGTMTAGKDEINGNRVVGYNRSPAAPVMGELSDAELDFRGITYRVYSLLQAENNPLLGEWAVLLAFSPLLDHQDLESMMLRTLTKINLSSLAVCGLFGFYAAQRGTGGHDCRQVRGGVAGIG